MLVVEILQSTRYAPMFVAVMMFSFVALPAAESFALTNVRNQIALQDFTIQAHRGAGSLAPENTLPSYELAWDNGWVPEADVSITADKVLIGFHDGNLSRVAKYADSTIKTTAISSLNWSQLENVDVGSYFSSAYSYERIPKISDVFAEMQGHSERRLYLDLKTSMLSSIASLAAEYGVESQVIAASSSYSLLNSWKALSPTSQTLLWMDYSTSSLATLRAANYANIDQMQLHVYLSSGSINPTAATIQSVAAEMEEHDILFQVLPYYTSATAYSDLMDLGVQSFASDYPDAVLSAVTSYYSIPEPSSIVLLIVAIVSTLIYVFRRKDYARHIMPKLLSLWIVATVAVAIAEGVEPQQTPAGKIKSEWNVRDHIPLAKITVQSHSGAGVLAPANTLEAFQLAWKLGTVPEADLRTTKDGVIVAFHDDNFQRLVKDVRPELKQKGIKDLNWAQAQKLEIVSPKGKKFSGCCVPSLYDILALMADRPVRRLYMDIKSIDPRQLANAVKMAKVESQVIFCSPDYDLIRRWKELVPKAETILWMGGDEKTLAKRIVDLRRTNFAGLTQLQIHIQTKKTDHGKTICPSESFLLETGKELRQHGILFQTLPWGQSDASIYWQLMDLGVASFATDHPDVVMTAIRQYYAGYNSALHTREQALLPTEFPSAAASANP